MHHSLGLFDIYPLKMYSRHREKVLRFYIFMARWTKIPLLGSVVRWVANLYGKKEHADYLLTAEEAEIIIGGAAGLAVGPCACREAFHNCEKPVNVEIMLGMTREVFARERPADYREISKEEAREIMAQCRREGLIPAVSKCRQDYYAICNCCTCCCVPYRLKKEHGINNAFVRKGSILEEMGEHKISAD